MFLFDICLCLVDFDVFYEVLIDMYCDLFDVDS